MSTRANVILKDGNEELFFYRHSDGYPEGVQNSLDEFCNRIKAESIRNNMSQASGWLVIIGHEEYKNHREGGMGWKVGAYEPTTGIHGDIEHLYEVDIQKGVWKEIPIPNI